MSKRNIKKEGSDIVPGDLVDMACPDCGSIYEMQYNFTIGITNYFECLSCGGEYVSNS